MHKKRKISNFTPDLQELESIIMSIFAHRKKQANQKNQND